jgi:hypothetical protein
MVTNLHEINHNNSNILLINCNYTARGIVLCTGKRYKAKGKPQCVTYMPHYLEEI